MTARSGQARRAASSMRKEGIGDRRSQSSRRDDRSRGGLDRHGRAGPVERGIDGRHGKHASVGGFEHHTPGSPCGQETQAPHDRQAEALREEGRHVDHHHDHFVEYDEHHVDDGCRRTVRFERPPGRRPPATRRLGNHNPTSECSSLGHHALDGHPGPARHRVGDPIWLRSRARRRRLTVDPAAPPQVRRIPLITVTPFGSSFLALPPCLWVGWLTVAEPGLSGHLDEYGVQSKTASCPTNMQRQRV